MNFFLNHALISLNTAPTPQNILLIKKVKHILMIWNMSYKSSSNSPSVQVLRQQTLKSICGHSWSVESMLNWCHESFWVLICTYKCLLCQVTMLIRYIGLTILKAKKNFKKKIEKMFVLKKKTSPPYMLE